MYPERPMHCNGYAREPQAHSPLPPVCRETNERSYAPNLPLHSSPSSRRRGRSSLFPLGRYIRDKNKSKRREEEEKSVRREEEEKR